MGGMTDRTVRWAAVVKAEDTVAADMNVFGWASISVDGRPIVDSHDHAIRPDVLEKAAYRHVAEYRASGADHDPGIAKTGVLIESIVFTPEKQAALGIPDGALPDAAWWVGYHYPPDLYESVVNGERRMLSIEGTARAVPNTDRAPLAKARQVTPSYDDNPATGPAYWLEDLDVTAVDLVAAGANPGAHLVLWKADRPATLPNRTDPPNYHDDGTPVDRTPTEDDTDMSDMTVDTAKADDTDTDDTDEATVDTDPAAGDDTVAKADTDTDSDGPPARRRTRKTKNADPGLPTDVAKALDAMRAENADLRARIEKAENEKAEAEARDMAGALPYVDTGDHRLAPVLKAAKATLDGDLFLDLIAMLKAADTALREGALVTAAGHDIVNDPDDRIAKAARDILNDTTGTTRDAAVVKAYEANGDLIAQDLRRRYGI